MSCDRFREDLVSFLFATLATEERDALESHLGRCGECVRELLTLKRAMDAADDGAAAPGPSAASRERLRQAIAVELGVTPVTRRRWERPLALAIAACVVLGAGLTASRIVAGVGGPPRGAVVRGAAPS
jgi:anti-sigma factor RsiW